MKKMYSLILAGGQGTRLWPQSVKKKPKQFLQLAGNDSLLESSLKRLSGFSTLEQIYIVSVESQRSLIEKIPATTFKTENMILEPSGKNTAPCLFLSLIRLIKDGAGSDDFVGIFPSDHVIESKSEFEATLNHISAYKDAKTKLFTIGIPPTHPHTGYGYIEKGKILTHSIFEVKQFKEKPSVDVASEYIKQGSFFWNAGIFVATIDTLMQAFEKYSPEIWKLKNELEKADTLEQTTRAYNKMPSISIDYCLLEKADNVATVKAEFNWNDLGSWDAFDQVLAESKGNHILSDLDFLEDSTGNIIYAPGKAVALVGMENFIVVHTEQALMIVPKDQAQKVKKIRDYIEKSKFSKKFL